jgi:uncharacterized membrane protein YozB (DUF420 family)
MIQLVVILVLSVAAAVLGIWSFVSAVTAPGSAFTTAGRMPKPAWVAITAVAGVIGLLSLPGPFQRFQPAGVLAVASVIASLVYLLAVRPQVKASRRPRREPPASGGW